AIEELSGGSYVPSPGMVYPTLTLLQDMGQIEEATSEGARKPFAVTEARTAGLAAKKEEGEALFARLAQLAAASRVRDVAPVRRGRQTWPAVWRYRRSRDDVKAETLHQVTDILDEAARKIERL